MTKRTLKTGTKILSESILKLFEAQLSLVNARELSPEERKAQRRRDSILKKLSRHQRDDAGLLAGAIQNLCSRTA